MLGYILDDTRGASDKLLFQVADLLLEQGLTLAGAVQENIVDNDHIPCDMVLRVLGREDHITISQKLGGGATGCRLDSGALEHAVGLVQATLTQKSDVLIVNKFGKQEIDGRGFRLLIAEALSRDIPVLTAIKPSQQAAFLEFSGEYSQKVGSDTKSIINWVLEHRKQHRNPQKRVG